MVAKRRLFGKKRLIGRCGKAANKGGANKAVYTDLWFVNRVVTRAASRAVHSLVNWAVNGAVE